MNTNEKRNINGTLLEYIVYLHFKSLSSVTINEKAVIQSKQKAEPCIHKHKKAILLKNSEAAHMYTKQVRQHTD